MEKVETCSFCGLTKDDVKFLVNGPGSLYVCNECIEGCMELWQDFQTKEKEMADYAANQHIIDNVTE